jgi:hypothetical protein
MAYCRFSDGDVYLYRSERGYECCACRLQPLGPTIFTKPDDFVRRIFGLTEPCSTCKGEFNGCTDCGMHGSLLIATAEEALQHLLDHRAAGHDVPDDAIEALREEVNPTEGGTAARQ